MGDEGELPIFVGDIEPGEHVLVSKLVLENTASPVLVAEGGMKWPLQLNVKFNALPGIEVAYQIKTSQNAQATEAKQRFTMTAPHTLRMLAKLDDGSMPEPMKRTVVATETPVAVAAPADSKSSSPQAVQAEAAAEKKRAAQEAKEAKAQAARDAKEAKEATRRAAEEAKEAKRRAANDKALPRKPVVEAPEPAPVMVAQAPVPVPLPVAEPIDAGTVAVAVDAGASPVMRPALPPIEARSAEEKGLPLPLIVGGAVVLLGIIVVLASRRKKT